MIVKSKKTSCYGCKYNKKGYCHWFKPHSKLIPHEVINKGCNFRVAIYDKINTIEIVGYIVDKFNGELL